MVITVKIYKVLHHCFCDEKDGDLTDRVFSSRGYVGERSTRENH